MPENDPKSMLEQLNAHASNWKGLALIVALAGGSGVGFDWLEPFGSGADVSTVEMEVDSLQAQLAVLTSKHDAERQLRELGVNGNTLQINNLRNRIAAVESRLLND